ARSFAVHPSATDLRVLDGLRLALEHVIEIVVHVLDIRFGSGDAAAHRDPGHVHAVPVAGDQVVPWVEVMALRHQPVGAGGGQPGDGSYVLRREPDAIGDNRKTVFVVAAAAGLGVEQSAAHAGEI